MPRLTLFRDKATGLAALHNWSHLVDSQVVLCKDGSLLAEWSYHTSDIASSADAERYWLSGGRNAALVRPGAGCAPWIDAVRLSAADDAGTALQSASVRLLRWMTKADPRMLKIYLRQIRGRGYDPTRSRPFRTE